MASKKRSKPVMQAIATTQDGRDITRGLVYGILPPQDEILLLKGGSDYRIYEEILRDPQVITCVQRRILSVVSREREVKPGGDKRIDKQAAEHLKMQCDRWWDEAAAKHLYGTFYGFSFAEMLYQIEDGKYVTDCRVRNRRRFKFWDDLSPRLLTQENLWHGEELPEHKFWYFSAGADNSDDPYGRGLAHWLYWPVWLKRNGQRFWAIFLEKFGMPSMLGKYQPGTSDEEQGKLLDAIQAIRSESGVIIPEGMIIEFLEASRGGTADYQAFLDQMDKYISKVVLGHSAAADATPGRLGGEDNAAGVAFYLAKADADLLCSSFNKSVAQWLTDWNFPGAKYPQLWITLEDGEDINARVNRDKTLGELGYPLKPEAVEEIYGPHYRLPEEDMADELVNLNGAQVQSLVAIIQAASAGEIPVETAIKLVNLAFPAISEMRAREMLAPVDAAKAASAKPDWGAQLAGGESPDQPVPTPSPEPDAPAFSAFDMTPCDLKDAIQLLRLSDPPAFADFWEGLTADFAGKNCTRGYNCGGSCITRRHNCIKALPGEARNFSEWMVAKMSANVGAVIGDAPAPEPTPEPTKADPSNPAEYYAEQAADLFDRELKPKIEKGMKKEVDDLKAAYADLAERKASGDLEREFNARTKEMRAEAEAAAAEGKLGLANQIKAERSGRMYLEPDEIEQYERDRLARDFRDRVNEKYRLGAAYANKMEDSADPETAQIKKAEADYAQLKTDIADQGDRWRPDDPTWGDNFDLNNPKELAKVKREVLSEAAKVKFDRDDINDQKLSQHDRAIENYARSL